MEQIEQNLNKIKIGKAGQDASRLPVLLAEKKPPGVEGKALRLRTNCKAISFTKEFPVYKYDVVIQFTVLVKETEKTLDFLKTGGRRDTTVKATAFSLVSKLTKANEGHFGSLWVYDRMSMLYSLKKMDTNTWTLKRDFVPGLPADATSIIVTVSPCKESFQSSYRDVGDICNRRPGSQKRELLEFLNLLVSNEALKKPQTFISVENVHYFFDPSAYGFHEKEFPTLEHALYIGSGITATVHVGLLNKKPTLYLVADVKKSVFHADGMSLLQKVQQYNVMERDGSIGAGGQRVLTQYLKGLAVSTTYGKPQNFPIMGFGQQAGQMKFDKDDGTKLSVLDYFRTVYKITLKYPKLPLVRSPKGFWFPLELLKVDDSQIATNQHMSPGNQAHNIKSSAVTPSVRLSQTEKSVAAMGLNSKNPTFAEAGVVVADQFMLIPGRELPTPGIQYKNFSAYLTGNFLWKVNPKYRYVESGSLRKWAIVTCMTPGDKKFVKIDEFFNSLIELAKNRGVAVDQPLHFELSDQSESGLEALFQKACHAGLLYLFFVSSDQITLHESIKAKEQKFQMITQEVRTSRAKRIQSDTLSNIVHKMNGKLGGICHTVSVSNTRANALLNSNEMMVVGLEFSHAPPQNASILSRKDNRMMPSVVGWGANCANHPQKIVGDYLYLEARNNEALTAKLADLFANLCAAFKRNRKCLPKVVVVYHNGISQGQWPLIADQFKSAIVKGCSQLKFAPKLLLLAVAKHHEERIYPEHINAADKPSGQNFTAPTVADQVIVSPVLNEFYLNAHSAIQGTAKTPKYTSIFDDTDLSNDTIQSLTMGLCYIHEIVPSAVSLPAPLMVADRCSDRGHKNYVLMNRSRGGEPMSVEEANSSLTNPVGGALSGIRYNS